MPRKMPPRSCSSPPPQTRVPLPSLELGIDWNLAFSPAFQTPQLTFVPIGTTSTNKRASNYKGKEKSEKSGVVAAWEEIRIRKSGVYTRDNQEAQKSIQDFTPTENTARVGKKIKKNRKVGKENNKPGKRTVSLQILPSSSTWTNLGLGQLRKSWTAGAASTDMQNLTAMVGEENKNKGNNKPEERKSLRSRLRAVSESKSTVGFGYEMYTPPKVTSKKGREPGESWLDLDDTPVSTMGRVDGGAVSGIRTPLLSTFVTAKPTSTPPITPPERGRSVARNSASTGPPPPQPQTLKALIQTHLTTTLLSLEIDIAQLDTRLFLIFDQLRTVHTSLLLRMPGITPPTASNNTAVLKRISNEEAKTRLQDLHQGLAALGKQIAGYFEMVGVVEMQIGEALVEEDYVAEGIVAEIGEDTLRGAVELRRQIRQVKSELTRVERKRKGLADWAGEVSMGWRFGEEQAREVNPTVMSPKSAPVTPVKNSSFLTVSSALTGTQTSPLARNRSIRGSRSMVTIASKPALNINKPLPASPGDGDFAMESRYMRSRSKSPAPQMHRERREEKEEVATRQTDETRPWESTLLPPSPSSPPPPLIPPRNPRRIVPRTAPPLHAESEIGLALSMPPSSPQRQQQRYSLTQDSRLSLDMTSLDRLIIPQRNISQSRSAREVYEDFFSMYDAGDDDEEEEVDSISQYSQDEPHIGGAEEEWAEDGDDREDIQFELPPLLPSIGPDSVFGGSNKSKSENGSDRGSLGGGGDDKNRTSLMTNVTSTSSQSESTSPTTPCSTSHSPTSSLFSIPLQPASSCTPGTSTAPTTPYTPYTPTFNIHRKPLPSHAVVEVPFTGYSNTTFQKPAHVSTTTPEVSPKMTWSNFKDNNTTPIFTSSSSTAAAAATVTAMATLTPQSPTSTSTPITPSPNNTTVTTTTTTINPPQFPFYSPSSFPHPPALNEVQQKVKRESMLRVNAIGGSEYPNMEIELLQCPPRGRGYVYAPPAAVPANGNCNTYIPPAVEEGNGNGSGGMRGKGLLKKLKLRGGSDKGNAGNASSTDVSGGEWMVDNTYTSGEGTTGDGEGRHMRFWKAKSQHQQHQHTGVRIFAV